jgi:hypothetical protein
VSSGVGSVYGIDIIEEAAAAAHRDRPGDYEWYLVADLTGLARDGRDAPTPQRSTRSRLTTYDRGMSNHHDWLLDLTPL